MMVINMDTLIIKKYALIDSKKEIINKESVK
jgi:hypothetical protein